MPANPKQTQPYHKAMKTENANQYEDFKPDYSAFVSKLKEKVDEMYEFLKENLGDAADELLEHTDALQRAAAEKYAEIREDDENNQE